MGSSGLPAKWPILQLSSTPNHVTLRLGFRVIHVMIRVTCWQRFLLGPIISHFHVVHRGPSEKLADHDS